MRHRSSLLLPREGLLLSFGISLLSRNRSSVTINLSGYGDELQVSLAARRASGARDTRHEMIDEKRRFCRLEFVIRRIFSCIHTAKLAPRARKTIPQGCKSSIKTDTFVDLLVQSSDAVACGSIRTFSFRRAAPCSTTPTPRGRPTRLQRVKNGEESRAKKYFCNTQKFTEKSPNNPPSRCCGRP